MKYFEVEFTLTPCSQVAQDLLSALAGEAGFETFEETATGLLGYVQQSLLDEAALKQTIDGFPLENISITYKVREAEDRDWNEQWEQEGFEPIVIRGERKEVRGEKEEVRDITLVIHDGRHLPAEMPALAIEIDAKNAFGTGTHETTRMICQTLLEMPLEGKRILDCGCGTGILGICALNLGATSCLSYDIDEWSADNTRHNAVINQVDGRLQAQCGDSSVLSGLAAEFDVVLANINRNILLGDMSRFVSVMAPEGTLILSGFYQSDIHMLEAKANTLGLTLCATKHDGEWAMTVYVKN